MINAIYNYMVLLLPQHKDHPFELLSIKDGGSVYMFGQRKALLQKKKDHVKATIYQRSDDPVIFKITCPELLDADSELKSAIFAAYQHAKANETLEEFGCCNSFVACSDALHCLHDDKPYYRGCMYRKNLEAGRVFYGKNKNV